MATNLCRAVSENDLEKVKILLENGEDINREDERGLFPLYIACDHNYTEIVKFLLENGADVNKKSSCISKDGSLHIASLYKNIQTISLLLEYGADINILDTRKRTPMHSISEAMMYYNYIRDNNIDESIDILLKHGADINAKDGDGNTPLHVACSCSHMTIARALVNKGARVNEKNKYGETPLYIISSMFLKDMGMIELLMEYGADYTIVVNGNECLSGCSEKEKKYLKEKYDTLFIKEPCEDD